ncbi:SRPBCC family protein [Aeromicrobium sp. CF4.19]|uniref:SRPBCC family protein n=1 Tax=Aeromicrobium sp. CF4.19 TaxID=3373082 RepID=UPI003EE5567A
MEHTPRTYSDSIVIAADPDTVYAVVSDVTRTGEWSPICQECWWDEGDGPRVGAHFTGRNVLPDRTWETRSQVIAAEPRRRFAWSVGPGRVQWGYVLEPVGPDGSSTQLTETWEFTAAGQSYFHERFGDDAPGEIENRTQLAREGIPATLAAIKGVIESD